MVALKSVLHVYGKLTLILDHACSLSDELMIMIKMRPQAGPLSARLGPGAMSGTGPLASVPAQ